MQCLKSGLHIVTEHVCNNVLKGISKLSMNDAETKSSGMSKCLTTVCNEIILRIIIPHQKLLQSEWSFTHQHFRCLVLSPFESCHMIYIMLLRKPNICHVRDIMLLCKPNISHASFRKVIRRRIVCSDTYNPQAM